MLKLQWPSFWLLCWFSSLALAQEPANYPPQSMPEHWRLTLVDETVFGSKVFVAAIGDPQLPTVLLVHGMGQAGLKDWRTLIPALEQRYHVVAVDLPGYGRSDKPAGKYSPTNYATVLHQIKRQFSDQPVTVVGHSMGGAASLRYADLYPDDVQQVVLVAAAGILERTAFVKHSLSALINGQQLPELLGEARSIVDLYIGDMVDWINQLPDPSSALGNYQLLWGGLLLNRANANAGLALVEEDFSAAIFSSRKPFTIIWGSDDPIAPLRTAKLLAGQLSHASLHIIDGAAHMPMFSHPRQFNDMLLAALAGGTSLARLPVAGPQLQELECKDQRGKTYSGRYTRIRIENCRDILLQDIQADSLVIKGSQLEIENLLVDAAAVAVAMIVDGSRVVATNIQLQGQTGMRVANSRIDFAGAKIHAAGAGLLVDGPTELVFSISQLHSGSYRGYLHGQYRIQQGDLEHRLLADL